MDEEDPGFDEYELPMSFGSKKGPKKHGKKVSAETKTAESPKHKVSILNSSAEIAPIEIPGKHEQQDKTDKHDANRPKRKHDEINNANHSEQPAISESKNSIQVLLPHIHKAAIRSIRMDTSNKLLVTTSLDRFVKLFSITYPDDIDIRAKLLHEWMPYTNHIPTYAEFHPASSRLLIMGEDISAKIYDNDSLVGSTPSGDIYIQDMAKTRGHTQALTSAKWLPNHLSHFLTSSLDSTVRLWDAETLTKDPMTSGKHVRLVRVRNERGQKIAPNLLDVNPDASRFVVCCNDDASLRIYDASCVSDRCVDSTKMFSAGCGVQASGLAYGWNNILNPFAITVHSTDGAVRIWDERNLKQIYAECFGLPCDSAGSLLGPHICEFSGNTLAVSTSKREKSTQDPTDKIKRVKDSSCW
eukprot:CAMPEP_0184696026 /NCGR_PEP_ID=MMETSP0313-20130426/3457_1 /TAXON_ID=2792 /ORGANISM="Porphyridium aerugineum, Strain SAG 1380-2" /LENGTH=412 /DNA_ID=CAMNT_0027154577 /DNA_START=182 /DNA_END=1417 /DNA_ORIENTATION=+